MRDLDLMKCNEPRENITGLDILSHVYHFQVSISCTHVIWETVPSWTNRGQTYMSKWNYWHWHNKSRLCLLVRPVLPFYHHNWLYKVSHWSISKQAPQLTLPSFDKTILSPLWLVVWCRASHIEGPFVDFPPFLLKEARRKGSTVCLQIACSFMYNPYFVKSQHHFQWSMLW